MGKGLSPLQREILILAGRAGGLILVADILNSLWGPAGENDSQPFSRRHVGEGYDQIHASLSRSCERLRLRGLTRTFKDVTASPGTIISLTADGIAMAKEIMEAEEEPDPGQP